MAKSLMFQLLAGLVFGIILFWVGTFFFEEPYQYQGSLIDPPVVAPDIELNSAYGSGFQLQEFQGKIVLLYFGYTFCPDVCPTTLYDLTRVLDTLGEKGNEIVVAMITVDPERDSLEVLGKYVSTFDPAFYGLSGELDQLESIWADYGVYREIKEMDNNLGYLVDHTARIYVIDHQGNLRMTFPFGMVWEAMADDLIHLLNE